MRIRTLLIVGVLLTFAGLYYLFCAWSLAALMTPTCHNYWDIGPSCRRVAFNAYAALLAPGPGIAMIVVAIVRVVRALFRPVRRGDLRAETYRQTPER